MKRLLTALLSILLLYGCAAPAGHMESNAPPIVQAPALTLTPTPAIMTAPTPAPTPVATASVALTEKNYLQPWEPDYALDIEASFTGEGFDLFWAFNSALTQGEWDTLPEAAALCPQYMPEGGEASVAIEEARNVWGPDWGVSTLEYKDEGFVDFATHISADLNLAYIEIYSGYDCILLLFDKREDGAYIPFKAVEITWGDYRFETFGGARWLVYSHRYVWGSGIWVEGVDWYNLDDGRVDISYCYSVGEMQLSWAPLGWWHFSGTLSEPQIIYDETKQLLTLHMTATTRLERHKDDENPMDHEEPGWDSAYPVAICYDMAAHRAYTCAGLTQWYHEPENVTNYARPFARELRELGKQRLGMAHWWAKWVLEGAGDWQDFYARNGLVYVERERDRG